eukprot:COSAG01_NODE_10586_length_2128_cov_1.787087_3_plen_78_part_00
MTVRRWRPLVTGEHGASISISGSTAVGLTAVAARESGVAVACRQSSREYEAPPPPLCTGAGSCASAAGAFSTRTDVA